MTAPQLRQGFSLREATPADLDAILRILVLATADDALWKKALGDPPFDDLLKWAHALLGQRTLAADMTTFVITEDATGKIVAYTSLQYPWKYRPLSEELKEKFSKPEVPQLLKAMDGERLGEVFASFGMTKNFGYDEENDYHRKGTMVLPDFQKKGFGTVLTHHCNAIADKTGDKTFVTARPTSKTMFEASGFKVLGVHDYQLERWGGDPAWNNHYVLVREPSS